MNPTHPVPVDSVMHFYIIAEMLLTADNAIQRQIIIIVNNNKQQRVDIILGRTALLSHQNCQK